MTFYRGFDYSMVGARGRVMNEMSKRKRAYSLFAAFFAACLTLSGCDRSPFSRDQANSSGIASQKEDVASPASTEPSETDLASCIAQRPPSSEYIPLTENDLKSVVVGHWVDWVTVEDGKRVVSPLVLYHPNGQMIVPADNAASAWKFAVRENCICSTYYYKCNAFYLSIKNKSTWMTARGQLVEISLREK